MIKIRFINKGFTLIELLVVITIMATIASIAVLSLRGTDSDTLADREVRRLYQLIKVASDSATLKNQQYGIRFNEEGYDFYQLSDERQWEKLSNQKLLKSHTYPFELETQLRINDIVVEIDDPDSLKAELEDEDKKEIKPQIMMLSDGDIIPDYELRLTNPETETIFTLQPGELNLLEYKKETLDDI